MAIGDTGGPLDSTNVLNIEGQSFMTPFKPTLNFRTSLVTGVVEVTDSRLTLDSIGGASSEIQYIEVRELPDLTPGDARPAVADYPLLPDAVARYRMDT